MSIYIRPRIPGATVFFSVALAERGVSQLTEEIACLRAAVGATFAQRPVRVDAWVVRPDHMHCVWTLPVGDADYATRWGAIKARFSMSRRRAGYRGPSRLPVVRSGRYAGTRPALRREKGKAGIWQRRFWEHHVRDEAEHRAYVEYCHINPVKHGFADRPEDWPYSTVHRRVR